LLAGREVRLALEQAGMVPGPQTIYHRTDAKGGVLASAANMLRPGDLDPQLLDDQQLRGLSLFSVLPGPMPPVRMLEELVAVARAVAWRLGAVVQDEHGAELDGERLVQIRQSLPDAAESGAR
jgi:cell division protein ZipA